MHVGRQKPLDMSQNLCEHFILFTSLTSRLKGNHGARFPAKIAGIQHIAGNHHQTFQVPKLEVLTSISCMDTAYVREHPPPPHRMK